MCKTDRHRSEGNADRLFSQLYVCLPKGIHSEAAHEIQDVLPKNVPGVGWGGVGWGGVGHVGVEWDGVGWVL